MAFSLWTYAYVTLSDVQQHVGGNASDWSTHVDTWGVRVNAACQVVENYLGRQVVARSVTEYRDGNGAPFIYPRHPPVSNLTIHLDTTRQWAASELLQATTPIAIDDDYFYDSAENCVRLLGWKLPGTPSSPVPAIVKLAYTGGWTYTTSGTWPGLTVTADSVPAAVRLATLLVIQNLSNLEGGISGKSMLGVSALSALQAGSVSPLSSAELVKAIPQQARDMLRPYARTWSGA